MAQQVDRFRALHQQQSPLILPNVSDAGGARLAEHLGSAAVATTSAGVAWSMGYPDGYALPIGLQVELTARIVRVLQVPLSVDAENGYSDDPAVVANNIVAIAKAGASGINLEDGKDDPSIVIPKLRAIRAALKTEGLDLFINLRTDVYLQQLVAGEKMVGETIDRGRVYKEAGADGLFVPALADSKEIRQIVDGLDMPINVMAWGGLPAADELGRLGVKRLSAGSGITQIIYQQMADLTGAFLKTGDSELLMKGYMGHGELQGLFR